MAAEYRPQDYRFARSVSFGDKNMPPRFWAMVCVNEETGCWEWTGGRNPGGYACYKINTGTKTAHRFAYLALVGPIADGLQLDHLCRTRHCVNPAHLEPVTRQENVRRGDQGKWAKAKTHCPHGHEYTPENTAFKRRGGCFVRVCRECGTAYWDKVRESKGFTKPKRVRDCTARRKKHDFAIR